MTLQKSISIRNCQLASNIGIHQRMASLWKRLWAVVIYIGEDIGAGGASTAWTGEGFF